MKSSGAIAQAASALPALQDKIDVALKGALTFEQAAQCFCELLYTEFAGGAALVRVFKTLPYETLPIKEAKFTLRALTKEESTKTKQPAAAMPVLTLMGSYGIESRWQDRRNSAGHLAIPLANSDYVRGIPMLARLLSELGVKLEVLDGALTYRRLIGGLNGIFYVLDADQERDELGRRIIPSKDFVAEFGIRAVFGMGGSYLDGSIVSAIIFCAEELPRSTAERLGSLISRFKIATEGLVARNKIFANV